MNFQTRLLQELRDVVVLALVGFLMTFLVGYYDDSKEFWEAGIFTALMWILLWKGNSGISHYIWQRDRWLQSPMTSFVIGFLLTVGYTLGVVYLMVKALEWVRNVNYRDPYAIMINTFVFTLIVTLFLNGRAFLMRWRRSVMDAEKLKRESITASYENLKNQVNPHFLFNSLNALTNLVYEDQDKAVKFIKQLSEVYRYVLESREKEVVSVADERRCLDAYMFLQKIRFGDKLMVDIRLDATDVFVAPLALQMLVENAIKHNIISADKPLTISVTIEDGYIVVRNTLQRKQLLPEESSGVGLENIKRRYSFLSDKHVEVIQGDNSFAVRLPVLKGERTV